MPESVPNPIRTPCAEGAAEGVPLRLGGVDDLRHGVGGPLLLGALLLHPVAGPDVGDEVGAALGHQRQRLVVGERAVLDRPDAGARRALDALGSVRVRRHEGAVVACLVDGRP